MNRLLKGYLSKSKIVHLLIMFAVIITIITAVLDIKTVAEGVETKDYVDYLQSIGCDIVQGYYFSKPAPIEEFTMRMEKDIHKI